MSVNGECDRDIFGRSPFTGYGERWRIGRLWARTPTQRAWILALVGWLPLALLSVIEGSFLTEHVKGSFLGGLSIHTRFLIALPLFPFAAAMLFPRLSQVAWSFVDVEMVPTDQHRAFCDAVDSTSRLARSVWAGIVAIVIAYVIVWAVLLQPELAPLRELPRWYFDEAASGDLSLAGWWHALVSLPLLLIALLMLLWRWGLWVRLLWHISRLRLRLIPVHPDGAAGLSFATYSVRACAPYAFLLGVIVAGPIAERVLHEHESPFAHLHMVVGLIVVVVVLFGAPLMLLTPQLLNAWQRGVLEYGALADRMGRAFEARWLDPGSQDDQNTGAALGEPDFSALTDLYSVVANVHTMSLFLVDVRGILLLAAAAALPFAPVLLIALPLDTVLEEMVKLLR